MASSVHREERERVFDIKVRKILRGQKSEELVLD